MVEVLTDTFRSVEVATEDYKPLRIDEGDTIRFTTDDGEVVEGHVDKISGKGEKVKFEITRERASWSEIWSVVAMQEGSLEVLEQE